LPSPKFLLLLFLATFFVLPPSVKALDISNSVIRSDMVRNDLNIRGRGVGVAVLDTGVDAFHPALTGRIVSQVDFTGEGVGDFNGHGTHVTGIVASQDATFIGVSPAADISSVKILNAVGWWFYDWYFQGTQWVYRNRDVFNIRVASLSAGEPYNTFNYEVGGTSLWSRAADELVDAGVVFVAIAGNEGQFDESEQIRDPGVAFNVITVGAVDDQGNADRDQSVLPQFSSRGPASGGRPKPDLVAPGVDIWSTLPNAAWGSGDGTSMVTPHVSGTVALMLEANPNLRPLQVKAALRQTAYLNNDLRGRSINARGWGIVDAYAATLQAQAPNSIDMNLSWDPFAWRSLEKIEHYSWGYTVKTVVFGVNSIGGFSLFSVLFNKTIVNNQTGQVQYVPDMLFGQISSSYVWVDHKRYFLEKRYFERGPRPLYINDGDRDYWLIIGEMRIEDMELKIMHSVKSWSLTIEPIWFVKNTGSRRHQFALLQFLDAKLITSTNNYVTYSWNGATIYSETKVYYMGLIVKNTMVSSPQLYLDPTYNDHPWEWILRGNPFTHDPDSELNSETVYDTDISLYYKADYPRIEPNYQWAVGPWIWISG